MVGRTLPSRFRNGLRSIAKAADGADGIAGKTAMPRRRSCGAGPNQGDWLVITTYANATTYEKTQSLFSEDTELQQVFIKIAKFATRISREMVVDLAR